MTTTIKIKEILEFLSLFEGLDELLREVLLFRLLRNHAEGTKDKNTTRILNALNSYGR